MRLGLNTIIFSKKFKLYTKNIYQIITNYLNKCIFPFQALKEHNNSTSSSPMKNNLQKLRPIIKMTPFLQIFI